MALLVLEKWRAKEIVIPNDINAEVTGARFKMGNDMLHIFGYYNPHRLKPNKKLFEFTESFENYLLLGDLNCKMQPWDDGTDANGVALQKILDENNGAILNNVNQPTFFHQRKDSPLNYSTLDLMIASSIFAARLNFIKTLPYSFVDTFQRKYYHLPLLATFDMEKQLEMAEKPKTQAFKYFQAEWGEVSGRIINK